MPKILTKNGQLRVFINAEYSTAYSRVPITSTMILTSASKENGKTLGVPGRVADSLFRPHPQQRARAKRPISFYLSPDRITSDPLPVIAHHMRIPLINFTQWWHWRLLRISVYKKWPCGSVEEGCLRHLKRKRLLAVRLSFVRSFVLNMNFVSTVKHSTCRPVTYKEPALAITNQPSLVGAKCLSCLITVIAGEKS